MAKQKNYLTCDGNQAAAHIAYMFSEVAAIYPITPSSTMAEYVDEWAAAGRKNIFGQPVLVQEMQSEAGAAGAMHGSLQAGALTSTFTASQGLLLMLPNMYKMAGELLPGVFHVSARALASHALSIFGDQQDVMAARPTGVALFATGSVQEVMDLAAVAHLAAIESRVPFMHFFDGFRTSHEIQKIEALSNDDLAPLINMDALKAFRDRALNPDNPVTRGTAQNDDIYFQAREASNPFYDAVPEVVEKYLEKLAGVTGRKYGLFNYYGDPKAERVIIAMGSVTETIREVVDHLNANGEKVGMVAVHLYRPFKADAFLSVIPETVKRIGVLDKTKEPGAPGQPLYLDVKDSFYGKENAPEIVGGIYGLSSKDTTPSQIISVFENLSMKLPKNDFTIGIVDDVTFKSLPVKEEVSMDETTYEAKFYGLGSDGTVGANKNSIKIIGDNTDKYVQAYFAYDSKKSGGFTCSHLRFGDNPIRSTYLVNTPNFVACHVPAYLHLYDVTAGLKKNGTFLLNSLWTKEEVPNHLPDNVKKYFAKNNIRLYIINATEIAEEIGLGNRTNTILQSAFFKISNVIPYDQAVDQMKKFIVKSYGRKGEDVVKMNYSAVDRGGDVEEVEIPKEWADIQVVAETPDDAPEFIRKVVRTVNAQRGYSLPVSAFSGREDGTWEQGTTKYEKRGVAVNVPVWKPESCIQCNQCAYVCPHATIRPFVLDEDEQKGLDEDVDILKAQGKQFAGMGFRVQVDVLDCLGCGNCADVCPGKKGEKALEMVPILTQYENQKNWDYMVNNVSSKAHLVDVKLNVKNSQFAKPLFEFSGACSGCGETPYIKLITQLYGDRMMIANATGCSSIYGASAPATPYTKNEEGKGPAWANSLFEDNAEFGYGFVIAHTSMRNHIQDLMQKALQSDAFTDEQKGLFGRWIEFKNDTDESKKVSEEIKASLSGSTEKIALEILSLEKYLAKKSIWVFGGDGWAYDIGFGGLDHVLASGQDINVLVLDTEVYSNTGGQSSKSTPIAAVAKFAAAGKRIRKKDLGMIATTYGYVYVAQVAMGANQSQTLKAFKEAESYNGPSIVIAYSPCISHGLRRGMGFSQAEQKAAVECGYWHLWRYDPRLEKEGKNPFQLDSKEPDWSKFKDFLMGEVRYTQLTKSFPQQAGELFDAAKENAQWRYRSYKRMAAASFADTTAGSEAEEEPAGGEN
ncbi:MULTISPECIES: pyruvate:ferredoxin (flavodoxin) oxidoreductase [Proteiniphilum]|jgi:pyruvate-ferredoxin/flavodoxin oxidoreductase|uniref:pyruvate:ferredoxin (flavodoxin) oxidoreductase n=1 Tax=Proteiniphilum TaxID=294702 RepID=UPI001EEB0611|nr:MULTISPECIES: pyruvate:ferredoxin (flavodoxin) oxidoreductase [Proteiniphilum]ULB34549.1 pyruvate:ferredoxin (flavodoxin) oxidoreductase [Proteiniphilum propionicum]